MIEIKNVTKSYTMGENKVTALSDVTLQIADGEFVAIMGPSGSGKSTLTHILGLLDVPTAGSYQLNHREVSHLSEDELSLLRRDEVGFIFQQFNLLPRLSAEENIELPLLYSKNNLQAKYSHELLNRMGLLSRSQHRPNELSGGQQQRIAIARALINRPQVIIADEPTGNLDSTSEKEILKILKELNSQGITVIIVTHEEEIGQQADRLIRLRDGVIISDQRKSMTDQPLLNNPENRNSNKSLTIKFRWIDLLEHFKQGYKTLAANKIRTALSMLGILIGVAAVVAMLAIGRGARTAIEDQLSSLGSNLLVLRTGSSRVAGVAQELGANTRLTYEDSIELKNQITYIKDTSTRVSTRAQVTYTNKNWSTQVLGVDPSYAHMHSSSPEVGRVFSEDENKKRTRVALIGATIVRELFGTQNPIGEMIKINKVNFQIIGILPEKGANGWQDQDDIIVVPVLAAMHRLMGKDYVDSIEFEIKEAAMTDSAEETILNLMYQRKKVPVSQQQDAFIIRNMADVQAALSESSQTMSILLATIAGISLLVGGIGIMNIMLVSVTERTKEIGLRKAIGATRKDILLQFLAEAVVVSVIGGIIGILLGCLTSYIISLTVGWLTAVTLESILLSFLFSATIGVVFGIYPAAKASSLNPIDALRFE